MLKVRGKVKQAADGWEAFIYVAGVPLSIGVFESRDRALWEMRLPR